MAEMAEIKNCSNCLHDCKIKPNWHCGAWKKNTVSPTSGTVYQMSNFYEVTENLLNCLEFEKIESFLIKKSKHSFNNADPSVFYSKILGRPEDVGIDSNIRFSQLGERLDSCAFFRCSDDLLLVDKPTVCESEIGIARYKQISDYSVIRGRVKQPYMPLILEVSLLGIHYDKRELSTIDYFIGSTNGFDWKVLFPQVTNREKDYIKYTNECVRYAVGHQKKQQGEWAVLISKNKGMSIRFGTDTTGIKNVFKYRDVPTNKKRRETLLHWVGDHYRKSRNNPEDLIYIQEYMRGATKFEWAGFTCEIVPSKVDLLKFQQLQENKR